MTNGELFIAENPNIEFKLNGSCVWIYFDGVNHYTMPVEWWEQEISLFDKIRAEIQTDKDNIENNNIYSRDVIDDGICIGLQMALDTISKHIRGEQE